MDSFLATVPKGYKSPVFLEELEALLTAEGTVSLECKVVGVPTPVLKWYKDGSEIKAGTSNLLLFDSVLITVTVLMV